MADQSWVKIDTVFGDMPAEILRGLLEAQGIEVLLSQEGAGRALGLTVGPLGEVQILVPSGQAQQALQILQDYRTGLYQDQEFSSETDSPQDPD